MEQVFYFKNMVFQIVILMAVWYTIYFTIEKAWDFFYSNDTECDTAKDWVIRFISFIPIWLCVVAFLVIATSWYTLVFIVYGTLISPCFNKTIKDISLEDDSFLKQSKIMMALIASDMFYSYGGLFFNAGISVGLDRKEVVKCNELIEQLNTVEDETDRVNLKNELWDLLDEMVSTLKIALTQYMKTFGVLFVLVFTIMILKSAISTPVEEVFVNGGMAGYCVMDSNDE